MGYCYSGMVQCEPRSLSPPCAPTRATGREWFDGRLDGSNDPDHATRGYTRHSSGCVSSNDLKRCTDCSEALQVPRVSNDFSSDLNRTMYVQIIPTIVQPLIRRVLAWFGRTPAPAVASNHSVNFVTRLLAAVALMHGTALAAAAWNPIIYADVPDLAMIRVGDTYYMSSTTMHMSPGLPIMKSKDLVNWQIVSYAYDILDDVDALKLSNGKNAYGQGSWASSLRYHDGIFYATTFSGTTGKTYVYTTKDIEHGPWKATSFKPMLHDHSLFFDDDGRVFMVNGGGNIRLTELTADVTAVKSVGFNQVIITNAGAVAGPNIGLNAEGSQLFKHDGKYYLFNITWPRGGMRTVIIHRADQITGPWEGRAAR